MAKVGFAVIFLLMFSSGVCALSVGELLLSTLSDKMDNFDKALEKINNRLSRVENVIGVNEQVLDIGDTKAKQETGKEKDTYSEMLKTSNIIRKTMAKEKHFLRTIIKDYGELKTEIIHLVSGINRTMLESNENLETKMTQLDIELNNHIDEQVTEISVKLDSIESNATTERQKILSELGVTQDQVTHIEKDQNAHKNNISVLESQLTSSNNDHKNKISVLESQLTSSNNQRSSDVTSLSNRISSLDNQRRSDVSSLSTRISSVNNQRSSDVSSLSTRISSVNSRVSSLDTSAQPRKSIRSSTDSRIDSLSTLHGKKARFNAELKHTKQYSKYSTIVFDNAFDSPYSAYSPSTGYFTAPYSGTYLFSVSVQGTTNKGAFAVLKNDGYIKLSVYSRKDAGVTGSATCVTYMSKGDKAWVESMGDYEFLRYRTRFAGVFLY